MFGDVRDALPQTLANLAIVIDMLKRYHKGLEQTLVILPQAPRRSSPGGARPFEQGTMGLLDLGPVDQPAAAVSHRVPACFPVAVAGRHQHGAAADGLYCKIPKDYQGNVVRGARNYPCVDVPGKRAATPRSAAATSRTSRWAPTRGTGTRTRS